jgi:multiple sugar transport system ATP-binding protein
MNLVETGTVTAGFRPEHFLPAGFLPPQERDLPLRFRVGHEEYLGAERILYGVVEGGPFDGRKVVSRIAATHAVRFAPDVVYDFAVAERNLKFFDPGSGMRTAPVHLQ